MSVAGLVRIRKAFALASHETASEHEALAAVRAAQRTMASIGVTWDNLTIDRLSGGGGASPSHMKMIQAIEALEVSERKLTAENARLKRRINELETTVERLEKPKARLTNRKPADAPRVVKEENMDVVETHDAEAREPTQEAHQRPREVIDDVAPETVAEAPHEAAPETTEATAETQDAPQAEEPKADTPKKRNYNRSPSASNKGFPFHENPAVYKRTIELYFSGKGKNAIADNLAQEFNPAPNFSQVFSVTSNGRPPAFLNAKVRQSGPMDWAEAWLIGSTLYAEVRSWLGPTLKALGIEKAPSAGLSFDLNEHAQEGRIEKLREDYNFYIANNPAKPKRGA